MLHCVRLFTCRGSRRAGRTASLPELAEVFCELLPCSRPVRLDAVAKLDHVALEVKLVLLEPRNVELLARCAALQLAVDILVVIANDSRYC